MSREDGNARGPQWKGPLGLSPAAKKRWSENQRLAKLRQDPAWTAKEKARQARRIDRRSQLRIPEEQFQQLTLAGMHVQRGPGSAPVSYIDQHGNLHREDHRSAEQLIQDFMKEQKRKEAPA